MTPPREGAAAGDHPVLRLDDVIHQRTRLGILAILVESTRADFTYLRDTLGLTDGNLSRHLAVLEDGGLVEITKTFEGRRPRTWLQITREGATALDAEVAALRELLHRLDSV